MFDIILIVANVITDSLSVKYADLLQKSINQDHLYHHSLRMASFVVIILIIVREPGLLQFAGESSSPYTGFPPQ